MMLKKYPLTMLLLAATLCVDVVVVWLASRGGDQATSTAQLLYMGQAGLLALWLLHGRTGFWFRVSCSLVFLLLSLLVPFNKDGEFIAHAAIYMMLVFILAGLFQLIFPHPSREDTALTKQASKNQYSVAHLLLLMTALGLLLTYIQIYEPQLDRMSYVAGLAAVPVAVYVLLWRKQHKWFNFALLIVLACLWSIFLAMVIEGSRNQMASIASSSSLAFAVFIANTVLIATVGIWLMVVEYEYTRHNESNHDVENSQKVG